MAKNEENMSFLIEIESINKDLFNFLVKQIELVKNNLNQIETIFKEYTDHSSLHSDKVLSIGENLNSCKLNIYEKAIFILAVYYHDIGMVISQDNFNSYIDNLGNDYNIDHYLDNIVVSERLSTTSIEEQKYFLALKYFRENHGNLSSRYILEEYPDDNKTNWYKDIYLWYHVALICKAHTESLEQIENNSEYSTGLLLQNNATINVIYLIMLLRLSDVCHFSIDRAYPYLFKNRIFKSEKSKNIWESYSDVVTTYPDKKTKTIKVQARCKNFYNHRAIMNHTKYIEKELQYGHRILNKTNSPYQFDWKYVDTLGVVKADSSTYQYYDTRFKIDHKKIITLLMGEKLYSDKLFSIRECIQNSVDSCEVIYNKVSKSNYIYLKYCDKEKPFLYIFDTGTGMSRDIVNKHFLSVGSNPYWYTEDFYDEWKVDRNEISFIADHGIGALSYFMIAEEIEIFSKYHHSNEFIHVQIDNYDDSIVFLNTCKDRFPLFQTRFKLFSPWEMNHGTCIKFHLKEKIPFHEMISFLSVHILRIVPELYFNYCDHELILPKVWHYRENYDRHCYKKSDTMYYWGMYEENEYSRKRDKTVDDIYKDFYEEKSDFYDNPPRDISMTENHISLINIEGKIHLNYSNEENMPIRISQNGILIKNAIDFIYNNKSDFVVIDGFGFDIDISGELMLQLDAERTNIIDNSYNKRIYKKIEDVLVNEYYRLISKIEAPVYFKCGGIFYHGFGDIIFNHPDSVKCFNANLKYIFLDEENKYKNIELEKMKRLKNAKLYLTGKTRNNPISVQNILEDRREYKLIVIKDKYLKTLFKNNTSIDLEGNHGIDENKSDLKEIIKRIKNFIKDVYDRSNEPLLYLPDGIDTFILPLVYYLDFDVIEENKKIAILRIIKDNKQMFNKKINLFKEFLQHKNRNYA